tara:strand:+ start:1205 stop:1450 length:246 start_codon:yes stop_codon:yes gene_type:complete
MNSLKDGTLFNLSLKYVGRRLVGGSSEVASVAKPREVMEAGNNARDACRSGGAFKHLNLVAVAAIVYKVPLLVVVVNVEVC